MDSDKPITVVNISPLRFSGGTKNQGKRQHIGIRLPRNINGSGHGSGHNSGGGFARHQNELR